MYYFLGAIIFIALLIVVGRILSKVVEIIVFIVLLIVLGLSDLLRHKSSPLDS